MALQSMRSSAPLRLNQVHGPFEGDFQIARSMSTKPVAAVVAWVPLTGHPEFIPYAVGCL